MGLSVTIVYFNGIIIQLTHGAVMKMELELVMDIKRSSMAVLMSKLLTRAHLYQLRIQLPSQVQLQLRPRLFQRFQLRQRNQLQNQLFQVMEKIHVQMEPLDLSPTKFVRNSTNATMVKPLSKTVAPDLHSIQ